MRHVWVIEGRVKGKDGQWVVVNTHIAKDKLFVPLSKWREVNSACVYRLVKYVPAKCLKEREQP